MPLIIQAATRENASQRAIVQMESYVDDPILNGLLPTVAARSYEERVGFYAALLMGDWGKVGVNVLEVLDGGEDGW